MRELLEQRVNEGETPKLEANIAGVEVGRMQADIILAQAEADGSAIELKALAGLAADAPLVLRDTLESLARVTPGAEPAPQTPATALAARPDVREAPHASRLPTHASRRRDARARGSHTVRSVP